MTTETTDAAVPVFQDYMNPILATLRTAGRPLTIEELDRRVFEAMSLPEEVVSLPHDPEKPDRPEVGYRSAWARTYLKKADLITNPRRGYWAITDQGRSAGDVDARQLASQVAQSTRAAGSEDDPGIAPPEDDDETLAARIAPELVTRLRATFDAMVAEGEIPTREQIQTYYRRFRERFGPDVLSGLDGETLIHTMHGRGAKKDSLVYWLEFKNDDEFPARFGSIGGGSALKFGIYYSVDSDRWMTGPGKAQEPVSVPRAIEIIRGQRDQLVAGARILSEYTPDSADFAAIQERLAEAAPDLYETSWGHKVFSLWFPELLAPFHGTDYQRHQVLKLLKTPGEGRYENDRYFCGIARQLDWTLDEFGAVLVSHNGSPHKYWRVGTTNDDGSSEWSRMRDGNFVSVGWEAISDLSEIEHSKDGKDRVRALVEEHYPTRANVVTRWAGQLFKFVTVMGERDIVLAMEGKTVRGIGRIVGDYHHQEGDGPFPHRRPVEWLRIGDWKLPTGEGLQTTVHELKKPETVIELESRLLGRQTPPSPEPVKKSESVQKPPPPPLTGLAQRIQNVLHRKRQVILYGPPGTGKTFWAALVARELAARSWFGLAPGDLDPAQRDALDAEGAVEICTFHPAYGYEDFLEGFRPAAKNGALVFDLKDGIFKRLCGRASSQPRRSYFLIIDEINRGDIPRIFGELITALERDKRGQQISLPLSGQPFTVPDNVFVLGTMNTADRSIALLDAALRRRFGFIELMPDASLFKDVSVGGLPLGPWFEELNRRVVRHAGRDARHLQVGHSYLMPGGTPLKDLGRFAEVLRDDIIPLLEEYCYEDFGALEKILGRDIVDTERKRINDGLFRAGRHEELVQALLSAFDTISATASAVAAEAKAAEGTSDDEDESEEDESSSEGGPA